MKKVRRFKVGESLNTIFSARQFGLALAVDIEAALKDFPEPSIYHLDIDVEPPRKTKPAAYDYRAVNVWMKKWFTEFNKNDEDV